MYSGIFGQQVMLKQRRGQIIMTILPVKPAREPSTKQTVVRERLKLAAKYGNVVRNDPALAAEYAPKARKGMSVYRQAVNNFLKPPVIREVNTSAYHGKPGEKISVTTLNDFKLTSVTVEIIDLNGIVVEEGKCEFVLPSGNYEYTATRKLSPHKGTTVLAKATDLPGHVAECKVSL